MGGEEMEMVQNTKRNAATQRASFGPLKIASEKDG